MRRRMSYCHPMPISSSHILAKLPMAIGPSRVDQGIRFYLEHYLIGHPGEPKSVEELREVTWLEAPGMQETMAAVGLAGMSNLHGNEQLHRLARQHYGLALQHTMKSIQNLDDLDVQHAMRVVVMLALFEVSSSWLKGYKLARSLAPPDRDSLLTSGVVPVLGGQRKSRAQRGRTNAHHGRRISHAKLCSMARILSRWDS